MNCEGSQFARVHEENVRRVTPFRPIELATRRVPKMISSSDQSCFNRLRSVGCQRVANLNQAAVLSKNHEKRASQEREASDSLAR